MGGNVLSFKSQGISPSGEYIPRGRTVLHTILEKHFNSFVESYDEKYAEECGRYSLERIIAVVEEYLKCGDYHEGVARVKCTNPECNHDFFVPFSCKQFLFYPSCSQKRTLLFGEYLVNEVLLKLPHKFFTFSIPKALRIFLKNDKKLFSDLSKLIYALIEDFYTEAAGRKILSGGALVYQSFGDMLRANSHFHGIILEGGFDNNGSFVFIQIHALDKMTECFRRRVICFFLNRELITEDFASNLLSWRNSGFSIDAKLRLYGSDEKSREALSQYIARPPLSLKKMSIEDNGEATVISYTSNNDFFKGKTETFPVTRFLLELTQHIPLRGSQYIRRYGLYASRTKGKWLKMPHVALRGGRRSTWNLLSQSNPTPKNQPVLSPTRRAAAPGPGCRKVPTVGIAKVYEVDPPPCIRCGSPMRILAVITASEEVRKIPVRGIWSKLVAHLRASI